MMSVSADSTLLQLQQEVVDMVDLPILIPAMNKEQLLTPEQNSHIDNGQLIPTSEALQGPHNLHLW